MLDLFAMIDDLSRASCKALLEAYSFAVYEEETVEMLREAVRVNYEDGTISGLDILSAYENEVD